MKSPSLRITAAVLIAALTAFITYISLTSDNRAGVVLALFALVGGVGGVLGTLFYEGRS